MSTQLLCPLLRTYCLPSTDPKISLAWTGPLETTWSITPLTTGPTCVGFPRESHSQKQSVGSKSCLHCAPSAVPRGSPHRQWEARSHAGSMFRSTLVHSYETGVLACFPSPWIFSASGSGGDTTLMKIQHIGLLLCVCFCNDVSPPQGTVYPLGAEAPLLHLCHGTHHHKAYGPVRRRANNLQGGCSPVTTGHMSEQQVLCQSKAVAKPKHTS